MNEIAQAFEIHQATVSRIVKMTDNFWEMGDLTPLPMGARHPMESPVNVLVLRATAWDCEHCE